MRKFIKVLSCVLSIMLLLTTFSPIVSAAQLKIDNIIAVNGESVCTLTIIRDNNTLVGVKDFELTYSVNGGDEKPLEILSLERGHKIVTITVPAFKATTVSQKITITEKNEKISTTFTIPASVYSVVFLPSPNQDITIKQDVAFHFGTRDFVVFDPNGNRLDNTNGSFAVRVSKVPANFALSGATITANASAVSTERADVEVEITNGEGTNVFKTLVFHVLVEKAPVMIQVTRNMLGERGVVTGQYAPFALFDEYGKISYPPDKADGYKPPIDSTKAINLNTWRIGGGADSWVDPSLTVNFGREYKLTDIYFYDGQKYAPSFWPQEGSKYEVTGGKFYVYSGETKLVDYTLTNEGKWVKVTIPDGVVTNSLKFVKESGGDIYYWSNLDQSWGRFGPYICDANIAEVVMCGIPLGPDPTPTPAPTPEPPEPPEQDPPDFGYTFGDMVGSNGFFNEDLKNYENISFIREYHNWVWTEASAGEGFEQTASTLNPNVMFTNRWSAFDNYYQQLKAQGVGVDICIQGGVSNTTGLSGTRPNYQGDKDSTKASSYYAHGASMFQHAARYGSNKNIDPNLVKVAPGTTKEIGLDLIQYYENWNEPNATWETAGNQFTAAQFAAMTSADYDGHMGTMGPGIGIKNADPNAKMVMGGLAGLATDYIKEMNKWFEANRTKEQWLRTHDTLDGYVMYPFDVINVHYYCPDGNTQTGLSPEDDNLNARISAMVSFRNRYYPKAELWLSEFGWDSNQGSPQSATVEYTNPKTGVLMNEGINKGLDGKEVQGRWLVREYLILAAAGVDRAQQFMMPDAGSGGSGRFESCGMIEMGTKERKPSWYYVGTMNHWLKTTKFEKTLETGKTDMLAYQFKEKDNDDRAIALWCTTSNNQVVNDYELTLPEGTNYAYAVTLTDKTKWGVVESLAITNGKVSIDVSEKPIFVLARNTELVQPPEISKITLNSSMVTRLTAGGSDPAGLVDDQGFDPLNGSAGPEINTTNWSLVKPEWNPWGGHRWILVDLGKEYNITNTFLYDAFGDLSASGDVLAMYYGSPGDWNIGVPGSQTGDQVEAQLQTPNWTQYITYDFRGWASWFRKDTNFKTRYLILGYPGNNSVGIPEMILYGYPADGGGGGEVPDPVFEAKPDVSTVDYLFDESFDTLTSGALTSSEASAHRFSTWGANVTVENKNAADASKGNVLKFTGTGTTTEFAIESFVPGLETGVWYNMDYKFKVSDDFSSPVLRFTNNNDIWSHIYNREGNNAFKPTFAGSSETRTVTKDVWHHLKTRFKFNPDTKYVDYEIFYDDVKISTGVYAAVSFPLTKLVIMTNVGDENSGKGVTYLDDVWVYKEKSQTSQAGKLVLTPSMAIRLTEGGTDPSGLLDDQGFDPLNDSAGPEINQTNWSLTKPEWNPWGGHRWILVDLGKEYNITNTFLYDAFGVLPSGDTFTMYYGSPGDWDIGEPGSQTGDQVEAQLQTSNWTQVLTYDFGGWASWFRKDANFKTRYLILGYPGNSCVGIPEMILYGN
jgi:hypothetical protein